MEKEVKLAIVGGIVAVIVAFIQFGIPIIMEYITTSNGVNTMPTGTAISPMVNMTPENKPLGLQNQTIDETNAPPELNELNSNLAGPQDARTDITWTADAYDPNNDPLEYRFLLSGPSTSNILAIKRDWASDKNWTWETTDKDIGNNIVQVQVRDGKHPGTSYDSKNENYKIDKNETDYQIRVTTGNKEKAGTNAKVYLTLYGEYGKVTGLLLDDDEKDNLERYQTDIFNFSDKEDVGNIKSIQLDSNGLSNYWQLARISIKNEETDTWWNFTIDDTLTDKKRSYVYHLNP